MTSRPEATMRRQDSQPLPVAWRALESGIGSETATPKANLACPVSAFPGTDPHQTIRGRPS